jgi:hypothetical protein
MKTPEKKFLSVKEFRELGFLQEVNRQFFHPVGLALEVVIDDNGSERLGRIWDYRDDPEGVWFDFKSWNHDYDDGTPSPQVKAQNVATARVKHLVARSDLFLQEYGPDNLDFDIEPIVWQIAEPSKPSA